MSKHTQGPWHVSGKSKCTVYDKFGQRIADSFEGVVTTQRSDAECQANARLIAAAPRMLNCLEIIFGKHAIGVLTLTEGDLERVEAIIADVRGEV